MSEKQHRFQQIQDAHWSKEKHTRRKPDHPVVRAVFDPLADIIASSIDKPSHASVLEVGCGNGYLQWTLEKQFALAVGLDYSEQMLQVNPCKEKCLGSCTSLPFADKSFDVAVATNLLHHLAEPDRIKTLTEMRRVARLTVVSIEPNRNNPLMFVFAMTRPEERMALRFSRCHMKELFIKAGLFDAHVHVEGWIVPNMAPVWWIPIGRTLGRTPLRMFGFYIYTTTQVS